MRKFVMLFAAIALFLVETGAYAGGEVVVYSARKEHLIKPLFDQFTKDTGIKVTYTTDKAPVLLQKILAEGKNTRADILMTVDAGNLWHAAEQGVLQPIKSGTLNSNIPEHLKDPKNRWFGLSVRARTIIYDSRDVQPDELSTYADLSNPKWENELCLRTSKKVYNRSLVAMLIAEKGYVETLDIVRGWVNSLAMKPTSGDTKVIEAILAGKCNVGVVNSYYLGRFVDKNGEIPVKIFWANQNSTGTHVNVSGAGVTKYAKNKENAVKLIEWLSGEKAQKIFAELNHEYPANPESKVSKLLAEWGTFKQNVINVSLAGELQDEAIKLMDEAGYK